ncbi:hypothetical protein BC940DRAFT_302647 [Gongronella butleri]|nr:hypothetical protein BC940DRAFT_302647 [Gongronella butleri]
MPWKKQKFTNSSFISYALSLCLASLSFSLFFYCCPPLSSSSIPDTTPHHTRFQDIILSPIFPSPPFHALMCPK